MSFPALIPEAVVIIGIPVEVDVKPILILRLLPLLKHILKSPEAAPHMVKDTVQNHMNPILFECLTDFRKIRIAAEAAINLRIVPRIVAVAVGFKYRRKIDRIRMQAL